jgi:hypothetical protein
VPLPYEPTKEERIRHPQASPQQVRSKMSTDNPAIYSVPKTIYSVPKTIFSEAFIHPNRGYNCS